MTGEQPQPGIAPVPVWDPRVRKWRVVILLMENNQVTARLPVDGYKTEQDARIAGLALMVTIQKKAQHPT